MNFENEISEIMEKYGYTRLEAIASMNLGERSEAAERVLKKRARRQELVVEHDLDFKTACLVVDSEFKRERRDNE